MSVPMRMPCGWVDARHAYVQQSLAGSGKVGLVEHFAFDGHEWGIFRKSIREVCSRSDSSCERKSKPLTSRNPPLRLHAQLGDLIRTHHSLSRVERAVEIVKVFCKAIRQGTWHRSSLKAYSWKNS